MRNHQPAFSEFLRMIPFGIPLQLQQASSEHIQQAPFEDLSGKSMSVFENITPKLGSWDTCILYACLKSYVSSRKLGLGSRVVG
jgi:hypothetical protein